MKHGITWQEQKDDRHLNFYIERTVMEQLEEYCEDVGQTKTIAIERILKQHLDSYEQSKKNALQGKNL